MEDCHFTEGGHTCGASVSKPILPALLPFTSISGQTVTKSSKTIVSSHIVEYAYNPSIPEAETGGLPRAPVLFYKREQRHRTGTGEYNW